LGQGRRNLAERVRQGRFREDLRYRLNVIPLVIPPLRDRREDIMPLVEQFLQEARDRTPTSPVTSFSDEATSMLTQAAWPGNVRELENMIERLVVLGRDSVVNASDLPFPRENAEGATLPAPEGTSYTLKQMNQLYLQRVLAQTNGDKAQAAKILNINLSTLYRWERAKG